MKFTALDAVDLGFNTWVVQDACRAVNLNPDDDVAAFEEMANAGAVLVLSDWYD